MFRKLIGAAVLLATPSIVSAQAAPTPVYLAKAGASDLFERRSGEVMATSRNREVRDFARMMTRDHAKSTADVKMAAKRARLTVSPPSLSRMQARDLAALKRARGADRDRLYVAQQKAAHRDALALQQGYATGGRVQSLKLAASNIVPVVRHHIQMLSRM